MHFLRCAVATMVIVLVGSGLLTAQETAAKQYEKLKKEIEGVAKDTNKYASNLKAAMESLSKVGTLEVKNRQKAVKAFQKDADALNKSLKNATDGIKSLREKRDKYFSEWERAIAAISNPDLKKASEERRQKVMADHAQLTEKATALRESINGFMKELADLTTFLGSDPTAGAASAAGSTIGKVLAEGNSLYREVQEVSIRLTQFAKGSV